MGTQFLTSGGHVLLPSHLRAHLLLSVLRTEEIQHAHRRGHHPSITPCIPRVFLRGARRLPLNAAIAAVAPTLLLIVVAVCSTLTFLPLWYLDCPYRPPTFHLSLACLGNCHDDLAAVSQID